MSIPRNLAIGGVVLYLTACASKPCMEYEMRWVQRARMVHGVWYSWTEQAPVCVARSWNE